MDESNPNHMKPNTKVLMERLKNSCGAGALKAPALPTIRLISLVVLLISIDHQDEQGPHETPKEPMTE